MLFMFHVADIVKLERTREHEKLVLNIAPISFTFPVLFFKETKIKFRSDQNQEISSICNEN